MLTVRISVTVKFDSIFLLFFGKQMRKICPNQTPPVLNLSIYHIIPTPPRAFLLIQRRILLRHPRRPPQRRYRLHDIAPTTATIQHFIPHEAFQPRSSAMPLQARVSPLQHLSDPFPVPLVVLAIRNGDIRVSAPAGIHPAAEVSL